MSFTATVENDTVRLPLGMHLPDGTKVNVEPADEPASAAKPNWRELMQKFPDAFMDHPSGFAEKRDR